MRAGFRQYISSVRNKIDRSIAKNMCSPINMAYIYTYIQYIYITSAIHEPHLMDDGFRWCRSDLAAAGDSLASMHGFLGTQCRLHHVCLCHSCADRLDQICRGSMVACLEIYFQDYHRQIGPHLWSRRRPTGNSEGPHRSMNRYHRDDGARPTLHCRCGAVGSRRPFPVPLPSSSDGTKELKGSNKLKSSDETTNHIPLRRVYYRQSHAMAFLYGM